MYLEGWEWYIDIVGMEVSQNQLVDFMVQWYMVIYFSGVNMQFENLNFLLQIYQEDFWCWVVDYQ